MKYFSKKIRNEHGEFDSKTEFNRYLYLKHLEDVGEIRDLQRQVRFEIIPKLIKKVEVQLKTKTKIVERVEERPAHYTADFCYYNSEGQYIILEIKGKYLGKLADYVLRRKLIKQIVYKHNQSVGYEDWIFEEFIPTKTKKRK